MGSYIEEFETEQENNNTVISICGPSGAGKGTLGKFVAETLDLSFYSAGDFFRDIADNKGISVEELSETADKETDIEVDRRTLQKGLNEDCVIESRISAWVLGDHADFKIFVTADLEERAQRVKKELENRKAESSGSLQEVKDRIRKRDKDNKKRYKKYYDIDMDNTDIFDLLIDNTEMDIEEQENMLKEVLKSEFPERGSI